MQIPRVFLGAGGGNSVWELAAGAYQDDGANYDVRARTVRWAPAGARGDALFVAATLAVTHTMAVVLWVTPYLDGVALEDQSITLAAQDERTTEVVKLALSVPFFNALETEVMRNGARGTWFELQVETRGGLAAGDLLVEVQEVEFEVLRESRAAQAIV